VLIILRHRFQVLESVWLQSRLFWDVIPFRFIDVLQCQDDGSCFKCDACVNAKFRSERLVVACPSASILTLRSLTKYYTKCLMFHSVIRGSSPRNILHRQHLPAPRQILVLPTQQGSSPVLPSVFSDTSRDRSCLHIRSHTVGLRILGRDSQAEKCGVKHSVLGMYS